MMMMMMMTMTVLALKWSLSFEYIVIHKLELTACFHHFSKKGFQKEGLQAKLGLKLDSLFTLQYFVR